MSPHDTLRDRLSDAAAPTATPLPNPRQLRTRAVRHRNQRRVLTGAGVALTAAAVVVAGSTLLGPRTTSIGPATEAPVPTGSTAAPTAEPSPAPSTTSTASPTAPALTTAPPALEQGAAQAFVEELRFELESTGVDPADEFAPRADTTDQGLLAHGCLSGNAQVSGVLAMRTATLPGPDRGSMRQVSVFADAASAASAFEDVRSQIRACHTERSGIAENGVEVSFVGEQLALGDQSFWVGTRDVVVDPGSGFAVGEELYFSTAAVLVLDQNVITVIDDPASGDDERAQVVAAATAEWERLRPAVEPVLR